ncbi:hypothetical protein A3C67_02380 [Candidatus Nomurabacteria bacterium RIFCSPHIGHO2_02_FULL_42_19]|uniref:Uncharacterized protein n=1 Tax=Candidatus Nomurabacteria bacterium RIFCSPHIGHO2_02_FULL_42_19 TaxID=1801756 RepID=A0A1F6W3P9_9BACT|nr:MAG: hypothetical protein A3C67_02380 [Candidatus Nomurabacteria bacterium RIFCSPHIGHO2_02_FULL_42_19]
MSEKSFFVVMTLGILVAAIASLWLAMHPGEPQWLEAWLLRHPKLYSFLERLEKRIPKWMDNI